MCMEAGVRTGCLPQSLSISAVISLKTDFESVHEYPWRPQDGPGEMKLQAFDGHLMWVLRTLLQSSESSKCFFFTTKPSLQPRPPYCLRPDLSLTVELNHLAGWAAWQTPGTDLSPPSQPWDYQHRLVYPFLHGLWRPKFTFSSL